MSEMRGLAAIVANNTNAVHAIAEPPDREDYPSEAHYESAYRLWWIQMNFWHAKAKP